VVPVGMPAEQGKGGAEVDMGITRVQYIHVICGCNLLRDAICFVLSVSCRVLACLPVCLRVQHR